VNNKFCCNWDFCCFCVSTYPSLETLTEPHRLLACLQCTVSVARSMLASSRWYPEGRLHVFPLMNLSLPGIDPNDIKKSLVCRLWSFHWLCTYSLVFIGYQSISQSVKKSRLRRRKWANTTMAPCKMHLKIKRWKSWAKRNVLSWRLKVSLKWTWRRGDGRLFQAHGAATVSDSLWSEYSRASVCCGQSHMIHYTSRFRLLHWLNDSLVASWHCGVCAKISAPHLLAKCVAKCVSNKSN